MTTQIELPVTCDRPVIVGLVDQIGQAIAQGNIVIDASAAAKPGQSLIQLLLSARKTAAAQGHSCMITPSAALSEMAAIAGVESALFGEVDA